MHKRFNPQRSWKEVCFVNKETGLGRGEWQDALTLACSKAELAVPAVFTAQCCLGRRQAALGPVPMCDSLKFCVPNLNAKGICVQKQNSQLDGGVGGRSLNIR